ncbi:chromosome partitioning protein ParB [Sphingobium jiangsuense]|uniref:ParB family chromosome partitioning protein n=2 Tax=Sphingobium jiangsuense TaxID=870476 RepID=A0A7W6BR93_9SPHN|nr:ParB family chromosome partitioning protein [Sphingobium jiangsuense]GLS99635.1 chromosome partitioning protein ParB [Sphingobium jiangsuense]
MTMKEEGESAVSETTDGANEREERAVRPQRRAHGLGRGLSALLGESLKEEPVARADGTPGETASAANGRSVQHIDISTIYPHPDQPRKQFDETALQELADSIAERGVIQPIIVRALARGGYQIVAGERRWRAAQRARLHQIPAIVRDFTDAETMEIALIENVQRQDLNPVEEAEAYSRLIAQFGHSQEVLGKLVGKSRSHVANMMRLLDLPGTVLDVVREGRLSMGHARALIGVEDAPQLAQRIIDKGLSVRQTEKLAQQAKGKTGKAASSPRSQRSRAEAQPDADIQALEQHLADMLGLKVTIDHGDNGAGTLTLRYSTLDQLDMLCQRLSGELI